MCSWKFHRYLDIRFGKLVVFIVFLSFDRNHLTQGPAVCLRACCPPCKFLLSLKSCWVFSCSLWIIGSQRVAAWLPVPARRPALGDSLLQQLSDSARAHALLCHRAANWVLCSVGTENFLLYSFLWTTLVLKNTSCFASFLKYMYFSSSGLLSTYVGF